MSRFRRVRTKAELDALINTVTKNKQKLQNEVTEEVVGKEFAKQGAQAQASPITAELQNVIKKIDEVLSPTQLEDRVPGKPWLGKTESTKVDKDTGERKKVVKSILQAMKKNKTLFKEIIDSYQIEVAPGDIRNFFQEAYETLGNIQINTADIEEVKTAVDNLSTTLHNDVTDVALTTGFISKLLKTEPENVIDLLKSNLAESKKLVSLVGNLRAAAGPQDLGGSPPKPKDPSAPALQDEEEEFEDAYSDEFSTPLPPASSLVKEKFKEKVLLTPSKTSSSSTSKKTIPLPSSTDAPLGVINSTSSSSVTPNPAEDTNEERNEKLQEKRAEEQLEAVQQSVDEMFGNKSIGFSVNLDPLQKFIDSNKITEGNLYDVLNSLTINEIFKLMDDTMSQKVAKKFMSNVEKQIESARSPGGKSLTLKSALEGAIANFIENNLGDVGVEFYKPNVSTPSRPRSGSKPDTRAEKAKEYNAKLRQTPARKRAASNPSRRKKVMKEPDEDLEDLDVDESTDVQGNESSPGAHGIGSGRHYDPYRMDGNGIMGKLQIDKPLLNRLLLRVHKDGQQIAYQPIPHDLVELLTKKYNSRKQYHPDAIELFQKLVRHSEIPFDAVRNAKFKNILSNMHESDKPKKAKGINKTSCECEDSEEPVRIIDSPEEALSRLNILLGELEAGNSNKAIKNEISQLLEYLHKHNHIHDDGYKQLMDACGLI